MPIIIQNGVRREVTVDQLIGLSSNLVVDSDPTRAPAYIGQKWTNFTNGRTFIAKNTTNIDDWAEAAIDQDIVAMANSLISAQNELLEIRNDLNSHESSEDPHEQYVQKVEGLEPVYLNQNNKLVNSSNNFIFGSEALLALSGVKVTLTGTTAETALYVVDIPDGIMGPNSAIEIQPVWTHTNSTNSKTLRVRISTVINGGSGDMAYERARTTTQYEAPMIRYVNRGVLNSQINAYGPNSNFATANASGTESIRSFNFAANNVKVFVTGQLANIAEEISLQSIMVKIINPRM